MHVLPFNSPSLGHIMKFLPVDVLIENKDGFMRSEYQRLIEQKADTNNSNQVEKGVSDPNTEYQQNSLLTLDEYPFPHVVHIFDDVLNEASLRSAYTKCAAFLKFDKKMSNLSHLINIDTGITILLSMKWMLVAVLKKPYIKAHGQNVFLTGLAYGGIINLQSEEKFWPQTAGIDEKVLNPIEALIISSS